MKRIQLSDVESHWDAIRPRIEDGFDVLWNTPELPCMEFGAVEALTAWLKAEGFSVEPGAFGIPTAFVARKRIGVGPCVGILAEYDALPGLGNCACHTRSEPPSEAGHACGHNHIGPANTGAAIAAVRSAQALGIGGEIKVIGCPAEELLWGKVALFVKGAFEDCDALLTSHGDYQNGAISRPCQAMATGEFVFVGQSSHGGYSGKVNALAGAEEALFALRDFKERYPDVPIKHIIRGDMKIAGVVPDDVRLYFSIRHLDVERAMDVYDAVVDLCRKVAERCGLDWRHLPISTCRGYLANDTLANVLFDSLSDVGPPKWSDADKDWMQQLAEQCAPAQPFELDETIRLYDEGQDYYSQDDGEVSWRIPLGRVNWAYPKQVPIHHWSWTALSGHTASRAGPHMASKAIALAAVRLLSEPRLINDAKSELMSRIEGKHICAPRLGAWTTLTQSPQSFWNGTWTEGEASQGLATLPSNR
ncbi:peptidase dimerization domain-containing protein [Paraburkholderia sp. RAU2J]|uniref:peptidase dimerization domain-containing protein n=1 Tax=Paraburkholderia sp. RAU2J TaxID=1938810 RepID=UPI000EB54A7A|nr:peptidase dimerization domain-containing protein [Paraburkholderia sp. RAU2J]